MKASVSGLVRLFVVFVLLGSAQSLYAGPIYNIVTGFAPTNPNGVWTYNANGAPFPNSEGGSNPIGLGLPGFWTGNPIPNSLVLVQNVSGSTVISSTVQSPTGSLWMDPESGNLSVLFTAPSAGTYTITGNFLGIDTGENSHPVEILDNGTVVFSGTISSFGQDDPFSLSETLNAGGTISFFVGTGSLDSSCYYCNLSTGLNGTITSNVTTTPEPGTLILFGSSLLGLVPVLRRKWPAQS
jgi:hypothetical protein